MLPAYDTAYARVHRLVRICEEKDAEYARKLAPDENNPLQPSEREQLEACKRQSARLLQLSSAALISLQLDGLQLETALVQLDALADLAAETGVAKMLGQGGFETTDVAQTLFPAHDAVRAYAQEHFPSLYARISKKNTTP